MTQRGKETALSWLTLSFGLASSVLTAAIVFAVARDLQPTLVIGVVAWILQTALFYSYARISVSADTQKSGQMIARVAHEPCVIWFTGLPSSGKTTLSLLLKGTLESLGLQVEHLDGDAVRAVLPGIGFSRSERNEHIRRMSFLASRFEQQGISVIASFVSPYRESRDFARRICKNFIEIYLSTDLATCTGRDVKGLYREVKAGKRSGMTGVDDPFEAPLAPELILDTATLSPEQCVQTIKELLLSRGLLQKKNAPYYGAVAKDYGSSLAA